MKAIIKSVEFNKEFESQHGTLYGFTITYDDKKHSINPNQRIRKNLLKDRKQNLLKKQ